MKYLLILIVSIGLFTSCKESSGNSDVQSAAAGDSSKFTTIQWLDSTKNLGKINEGQKVEVAFKFKNTGNYPLVIQSVHPGCGCTVADYPKEPIAPGAEGQITGSFNSQGREGMQHKEITVMANTSGTQEHHVYFEVEVVKSKS